MTSVRRATAVTAVLAAAILVVGCSGPGSQPAVPSTDPAAAAGATSDPAAATPAPDPTAAPTPSAAGWYPACAGAGTTPVTITAWDRETDPAIRGVIDDLAAEFAAANPGVTIRVQAGADGPVDSVIAALTLAEGPDVVQIEQGRAGMGQAVANGLLLPLTPYTEQYRWDRRWAPGILARGSFAGDGTGWGSGTLYGVPLTADVVGYFFNHRMAAERPSRPKPTTLAEEMEDYAAIKEAGFVPIVLGTADGRDAVALFGTLVESMVEPGWSDDIVYGRAGGTFVTPAVVAAAQRLVELGERGFLSPDHASIGHEEAVARFAAGGGQLLVGGTDIMPALAAATETVGYYGWLFYPPQPAEPDGYARAIGGIGAPWAIRASSGNADCAAAWLDFLTGDHAAELLAAAGVLPSHYEGGAPTEMLGNMGTVLAEVSRQDRLGHRLEEAFPGAGETIAAGLAELMAGEITPKELAERIDEAYQAYIATLP